jgi:hypothetical protein
MLLSDLVFVIKHFLPKGKVGEQLNRLASGFFDD